MSICNFDCLHCSYDDCINDELTFADYKAEKWLDRLTGAKDSKGEQKPQEKASWYQRNREYALAYQKAYGEKNIEKRKAYYAANRERLLTRQKERYQKNREEVNARQRENRRKKREERRKDGQTEKQTGQGD